MKLRDWPEFDLIRPAGADHLIVGSKTARPIDKTGFDFITKTRLCTGSACPVVNRPPEMH